MIPCSLLLSTIGAHDAALHLLRTTIWI